MPRYLVTLEYDGAGFHGFQKQPGLLTVQGSFEKALLSLTGDEVRVYGAGRTDAGVHALGQAVAFDLARELDLDGAMRSLNGLMPEGAAVTGMMPVPDRFDPRRDALWREYRYFILNRRTPSPLLRNYTYHHPRELDRGLMGEACSMIQGGHDFSAFRVKAEEKSTVLDVLLCGLDEYLPGLLCITMRSRSFLYRMVRVTAGAVLAVGGGRMGLDELGSHLEGGNGPCADPLPAYGLFLWEVVYPPDRLRR